MQMQSKSSEEFWDNIANYSISAAVIALRLQPGEPAINLKDLVVCLSNFEMLKNIVGNIRTTDSEDHKSGKAYLVSYLKYWWNDDKNCYNSSHYKNLMLGPIAKLSSYCHSTYDHILNSYTPDVNVKDCILNGKVVILSMSSLADKTGTELLGRLFIADIARAVGEIQQEKSRNLLSTPIILDEYGSFNDITQLDLFQLARSAWVPLIIALQGKGFFDDSNKNFAENALGQCQTHLYGDVRDQQTREFASYMSGTMVEKLIQEGYGSNFASTAGSESTGMVTTDSTGLSYTKGYKEQRDTLIQPDDFLDLDKGDAIMVGSTGVSKVRMPLTVTQYPTYHWHEMHLTRHTKTETRPGLRLWDTYIKETASFLGINL